MVTRQRFRVRGSPERTASPVRSQTGSFMSTCTHDNEFRVIGFDARRPPQIFEGYTVFTVDIDVWGRDLPESVAEDFGSNGSIQGLWCSFSELKAHVEKNDASKETAFLAVTWSPEGALREGLVPDREPVEMDGIYWSYANFSSLCNPDSLRAPWTFLGYDVADAWLTSGLWNYGFGVNGMEHVPILRDNNMRLNRCGLFQDMGDAVRYAKIINAIAQAEAPFSPYGIWLLDSRAASCLPAEDRDGRV